MAPLAPSPLKRVDRMAWWLWAGTFTVIIALAITVPMLYQRLIVLTSANEAPLWIASGYHVWVGLGGLALVFCLYTGLRHRELQRMRDQLQHEAAELDDMRLRLSEVSELFGVSTTLNLQLRLDVILEIIVRRVVSTLRAQQASIMIFDPDTGMLRTRASYGLEAHARHSERRLGEGIAGWVAERQEAVLLGPDQGDQNLRQHFKADRNISSALSLPLKVGDRCVGVLNVNRVSQDSPFREHHRDTLHLFAEHVASVIDRASMLERVSARAQALESSNQELADLKRKAERFMDRLGSILDSVLAALDTTSDPRRTEARRVLAAALEVARVEIEDPELVVEAGSLENVVRAAVERARPAAHARWVQLGVEIDERLPPARVDAERLTEVVATLIDRAIVRSPEGAKVEVRVHGGGRGVRIEVIDRGPRLALERARAGFDVFVPEPAGDADPGAFRHHLARRVVERHGGELSVETSATGSNLVAIALPPGDEEEGAAAA